MEKIIELLFSKEGIDDSKIIRLLSYLLNVIICSWLYTKLFGEYELIDFLNTKELADFFLKGNALIVIICYGMVNITFSLLRIAIYFSYRSFLIPSYKKKLGYTEEQIGSSGATLHHITLFPYKGKIYSIGSLFESFGMIKPIAGTNIIVFDDILFNLWVEYLKNPLILMINCIKLYTIVCKFIVAYFIVNSFYGLPIWLNYIFIVGLVLATFMMVCVVVFVSMIELWVPAFRNFVSVSNSRYFHDNYMSDLSPVVPGNNQDISE